MSRIVLIIQARMGSSRFPGKVMADLQGKPLLAHVVERAKQVSGVNHVVVASTAAPRDQPVIDLAHLHGADAFAGSEDDVLDRYYQAAKLFRAQVVVRVSADCPLLDPAVSEVVLRSFLDLKVDYVSNIDPPTYPDGLDTEVFSFAALERAWREARLRSEREHVTPYIRNHPELFRLKNVEHSKDFSALRWTVDEPRDLEFARVIYSRFGTPNFGMEDILKLLRNEPQLASINAGINRNEGYAKSLRDDVLKPVEA